ncbi:MAG: redoxin domain-containing protein [Planctomycetales bacterium]|nr:redoxin domain-containing protein [Planctomycetales bacterium]
MNRVDWDNAWRAGATVCVPLSGSSAGSGRQLFFSAEGRAMMRFMGGVIGIGLMFASAVAIAQEPESLVAEAAGDTRPLEVGAEAPDVELTRPDGTAVRLADLHAERPLVIVFFRGSWCPFCNRHTQALARVYPGIKEAGAELIAVSPDNLTNTRDNVEKNEIPFPVYSDSSVAATKAFGLAFRVDDQTIERYRGFGIDLERASGYDHHALPVPAVFIIDTDGKIAFAHSDPNYRVRLDAEKILEQVKELD